MKKITLLALVLLLAMAFTACANNGTQPTQLGTSDFSIVLPAGYASAEDDMAEDQVAYFCKDDNSVDFDVYQWAKGDDYTLESEANAYAEQYNTTAEAVVVNEINGMKYVSEEEYEGITYTVLNYMFEDDVNIVEICFWTNATEAEYSVVNKILSTLKKNVSSGAENQKKADDYATALAKIIDRDYEGAYALFEQLGDYKDSKKYLENFYYMPTTTGFNLVGKSGTIDILYNANNLPVKEISHRADMERTTEFEYDEVGNVVKQIAIINGESSSYTYVYNENGYYDYAHYVGADGSECTYDYTYNEKGYRITETYSDSYENSYVCSFTYDDNGNLTRMAYEVGDEVHSLDITYTFDENGYITKKVSNYSDGAEEILEYTYDEEGKEIKCVFEAYDDSVTTFDYTYDDNGNLIKTTSTDADGVQETVELTYKLMYLPLGYTVGSYYFFEGYWTSVLAPLEYYQ